MGRVHNQIAWAPPWPPMNFFWNEKKNIEKYCLTLTHFLIAKKEKLLQQHIDKKKVINNVYAQRYFNGNENYG